MGAILRTRSGISQGQVRSTEGSVLLVLYRCSTKMLGNLFGGGGGAAPEGKVVTKVFFDIEIGGAPAGPALSLCRATPCCRMQPYIRP